MNIPVNEKHILRPPLPLAGEGRGEGNGQGESTFHLLGRRVALSVRPIALGLVALIFSGLVLDRAQAGGNHFYTPVRDALVKEECGSCHLAFSPAMLPASSWQRMMADLSNHFGDDASVDADTAAKITRYLVDNSADRGNQRFNDKLMRGVSMSNAPLRITELPKWQREHREVPAWEWRHKDVRTKTNCVACHTGAEQGYYDD